MRSYGSRFDLMIPADRDTTKFGYGEFRRLTLRELPTTRFYRFSSHTVCSTQSLNFCVLLCRIQPMCFADAIPTTTVHLPLFLINTCPRSSTTHCSRSNLALTVNRFSILIPNGHGFHSSPKFLVKVPNPSLLISPSRTRRQRASLKRAKRDLSDGHQGSLAAQRGGANFPGRRTNDDLPLPRRPTGLFCRACCCAPNGGLREWADGLS